MRILCLFAAAGLLAATPLQNAPAQAETAQKPGAHLVLQLQTAEVTAHWLTALRDDVRGRLREANIGIGRLIVADNSVQLRLAKPEDADAAMQRLANLDLPEPDGYWARAVIWLLGAKERDVTVVKGEAGAITITPTPDGSDRRKRAALADVVEIASKRLNAMGFAGTAEPQDADRIRVHVPALTETDEIKQLLTRPGRLGFHEAHPTLNVAEARRTRVPVGYKIVFDPAGDLLLRESPLLRGSDLVDAQPGFDQRTQEPVVSFRFNANGTRSFAKFTAENIGRPFAIVLDEQVLSAPVIREPILAGSGQVSGNFTVASARELAVLLRGGALPARLVVVEERVVPRGG